MIIIESIKPKPSGWISKFETSSPLPGPGRLPRPAASHWRPAAAAAAAAPATQFVTVGFHCDKSLT
jgi:hypothetical protein